MGKFGNISLRRTGDIVEVKLIDNTFNVFFKGKANINNPSQMEELRENLRQKGVPL